MSLHPHPRLQSYRSAQHLHTSKPGDLIEPPTGHGRPFLSLLPDPLNSSSATPLSSSASVHKPRPTSCISTSLSSTSPPSDGSTFPRKRRHEESSEHDSRSTASTGPKVMCRGPSSPLAVHSSTPIIPQRKRFNLALDATSTEPSLPSQWKLRHISPSSNRHPTLHMSRCAFRARPPRCSTPCRRSSWPTGTCATRTRTTACSRAHAQGALPPCQDRLAHARPGRSSL